MRDGHAADVSAVFLSDKLLGMLMLLLAALALEQSMEVNSLVDIYYLPSCSDEEKSFFIENGQE